MYQDLLALPEHVVGEIMLRTGASLLAARFRHSIGDRICVQLVSLHGLP